MQLGEEPHEDDFPEEENQRTKKQSPFRWLAVCGGLGLAGVVAGGEGEDRDFNNEMIRNSDV